jgi:hypothetical protein
MPATGGLPIELMVYNKAYQRRGPVGAVLSLSGELQFNAVGLLQFTVPATHRRVPDLVTAGARIVAVYKPAGAPPVTLMSGRVSAVGGGGPRNAQWRRFEVIDDWTVLHEVQCWPNPTGTIAQQGADSAYFTRSGPAETVLKQLLAPNVTRQGVALTIPTTQGRGSSITGKVRFHTVVERLFPAFEQAGLGVRVVQNGATRTLDVYTPATYPQVLTQGSGVVVSGEYELTPPTVTRVLVAAGGEGTARLFRQKVDTAAEALYGIQLPVFRDARDVAADDPDLEAVLTERMDETLAEGAAQASLKCELSETDRFRYGVTFGLGDRVSVELNGAPVITDIVRSVAIDWTPADGLRIVPRVGEWNDVADDALVSQVGSLTRAVKDLQTR